MKYATAFLMTAEAALYFAFAMLFPALAGYYPFILLFLGLAFLGMFLAETLRNIRVLRALPVLITVAAVIAAPRTAWLLMFLPPFLYLLLTAVLGYFQRPYWRCVLVAKWLLAFWIAFSMIALVLTPVGIRTLLLIAVSFLCCVCGLRMRRMNATDSPGWMVCSFAELLPLPAAGLAGVGIANLVLYGRRVVEILLTPFAMLFSFFSWIFVWLNKWMKPMEEKVKDTTEEMERIADLTEKAIDELEGPAPTDPDPILPKVAVNWKLVFIILFLAATAVVLVLIFRKRQKMREDPTGDATGGRSFLTGRKRRKEHRAKTPSERIRQCYRAYLEIQRQRGLGRVPGDTSMDILRFSEHEATEVLEERLRDLYVKARYLGSAENEEAREAENLLETLKKTWNAG